jgi:hypothetical protein
MTGKSDPFDGLDVDALLAQPGQRYASDDYETWAASQGPDQAGHYTTSDWASATIAELWLHRLEQGYGYIPRHAADT